LRIVAKRKIIKRRGANVIHLEGGQIGGQGGQIK